MSQLNTCVTRTAAVLTAALLASGCANTCEEAAEKIGLDSGPGVNAIAKSFFEKQLSIPPHGNCGPNTIANLQVCQGESPDDIAARGGIVCPQQPRVSKVLDADQSAGPTTDIQMNVRVSPIASFQGVLRASGQANSCSWELVHIHDGSGQQGRQDPQQFARRQYLATLSFKLEAQSDTTIRYISDGELKTVDIDAGSSCATQGLVYNGCENVQDGGACNAATELQPVTTLETPADGPPPENGEPGDQG
jgi:hypothetical protein